MKDKILKSLLVFVVAAVVSSAVWLILGALFSISATFTDLLILTLSVTVFGFLQRILKMAFFRARPTGTAAENLRTLVEGVVIIVGMAVLFGGLALIGFDGSSPSLKKVLLLSVAYGLGNWTFFRLREHRLN